MPEAQVTRVHAREGISMLFDVDAVFLGDDPDLDLDSLLRLAAAVGIGDSKGGVRVFHGNVDDAEYVGPVPAHGGGQPMHFFRLRLRPGIHALSYRVRTRIFQDLDVIGIVKKVCKDSGLPDAMFDWSQVKGPYPSREFCMQYKESELSFVLRLLEEEGIFFWFEHSQSGHVMHFGEGANAYQPIDGTPNLTHFDVRMGMAPDTEGLYDLTFRTKLCHEVFRSRDWNWQRPRNPLDGKATGDAVTGLTAYEYPGGFTSTQQGGGLAQTRLEAARVEKFVLEGWTNSWRMLPGRKFTLQNAAPAYLDNEYVLLSVWHDFRLDTHLDTAHGSGRYQAQLRAVPSTVIFRPPRITPRPRIFGKESAVVTGPEEIHVDDNGRIKVHFYFDREGAVDEKASCWIRVQQQNTSGAMILPRRGWEVSVGFVDGNPDRPMVLQKLYNAETMPPYALPANKTQSALQSSTTPGGGSTNEVRVQDSDGGMDFFVHSSKDFTMTAGVDLLEDIAVDALEETGAVLTTAVVGSETATIGSKQSINVTGDCTNTTNGAKTITIGASDDLGVKGNASLKCDGSRTETISGLMNVLANSVGETFNAGCSRTVSAAQSIVSATAIIDTAGGAKSELVGAAKLEICTKAKAEQIAAAKTLVAGFLKEKTGADIGYSAKGAVGFQVGGAIAEKCGGDFTCGAKAILVTAAGGINIKGGGTPYTLKGANIKVDAGSMGIDGAASLKLDGTVKYKP
jgi:type VI secretion system secreted protein VgrG